MALAARARARTFAASTAGRHQRLRQEVGAHEATLRELEIARRELKGRVAERTQELGLVTARFRTALRGSKIYVFSQDRRIAFTPL